MTYEEFKLAYQPLAVKFPEQFKTEHARMTFFNGVQGFADAWINTLVGKILLSNNPRFNVLEEIEKEKRRRGFERTNSDNAEEIERMKRNATGKGLDALMKEHGVTSAVDLIGKIK